MIRFPPAKILVPFDFTDPSKAAWALAQRWARRFKARTDVAYIEDLLPIPAWEWRKSRLSARVKRDIAAHLRSRVGESPVLHVGEGEVADRLLAMTRSLRPDLLVMGTHGRTGLERLWLGSVTEAMTRLAPVPVLALRAAAPEIESVVAPVNFTPYSEYGLIYAAAVAAALGKPLVALHVSSDARYANPEFRLRNMIFRLGDEVRKRCRPQVLVERGSPAEGILRASRRHGLVVLVAHRKPLLEDWVLGMTVERVLRHSPVPVLAVPAPKSGFNWEKWVERRESVSVPA